MRCIVTGGCGFIGGHVVNALRAAGHQVLIIDSLDRAEKQINICDTDALISAFQAYRPEIVFHIAAIADARETLKDPVRAVQINTAGTASVFEASRQAEASRVILASTCWVAGAMRAGVIDETEPFQHDGAGHIYTTTKIASELIAHDFYALYKLPFTILRYGIPYGPGMWSGLVLRSFLDCIAQNKPLMIFGDGSASRRFLYVEDLARAHVLALSETATNQVYNLEGMEAISVRRLAETVRNFFPMTEILYREEPTRVGEFKYFRQVVSSAKAQIELGWQAKVSLVDGIRETIKWYNEAIAPLAEVTDLYAALEA